MSTSSLAAALVKAQGEFPAIEKRRTAKIGNQYSYKYADLGDVLKGVGPALRKHGLVLVFGGEQNGAGPVVTATLLHAESGESLTASLPLVPDDDPKQLGSRITYLRRYLAAMLCGVAADEDDDGTAASGSRESRGGAPRSAAPSPNAADMGRVKLRLDTEFGEGGLYDKGEDGQLTTAARLKLKVLSEAFGETKWSALMAMDPEAFHQMARDNFLPAVERVAAEAAQQELL